MKEIKFKKTKLKEDLAILIAAFGSTTSGKLVYEIFDECLKSNIKDTRIEWAFTSEIIRHETGQPGVLEAISTLEAEGYRKIVVQPLHIFPATEYRVLEQTCSSFPGIRVAMGETLLHRWHFIDEVFKVLADDFLPSDQGLNIVIGHGTPLCMDPVTAVYLGLDYYLTQKFENVYFSTVDGVPDKQITLQKICNDLENPPPYLSNLLASKRKKIRLIPLMFVAGLHVKEDILAENDSFKSDLEEMGFEVDYPTFSHKGKTYPKGLGLNNQIMEFFLQRIERSLDLMKYY